MSDDVGVLQVPCVTVDKELFWRNAVDPHLALVFLAADLDAVDRHLNFHAHWVDGHRVFNCVLKNADSVVVQKVGVFVVRQV